MMRVDLEAFLSDEDKKHSFSTVIETDTLSLVRASYPFTGDCKADFTFTRGDGGTVRLDCTVSASLLMPCDRCLKPVEVPFHFNLSRDIDIKKAVDDASSDSDDAVFMDGSGFDTEAFVRSEIILRLPVKVLCREDCKGLCSRCGADLNDGPCGCNETLLDPRMAKAIDVYKQFKEV